MSSGYYGGGSAPTSHSGLDLDEPPTTPPDRIKPSMSAPGDDTMSLLGAPNADGEGMGASMMTPTGRALGGVMRMMEGANLIESVVPGAIPPQLLQLIQQLSVTLPDIVRNMEQMPTAPTMTGPGGMLTGFGQSSPMNPGMGIGGGGGAAGAPNGEGSPMMPMPM